MRPLSDHRLILIDDDAAELKATTTLLGNQGFEILPFKNPAMAIDAARERPPRVILCREEVARAKGFDLIAAVKRFSPCTNIILFTASPALEDALSLLRSGAFDVVPRPIDGDLLQSIITRAARAAELEELNLQYVDELATRERGLRSDLALARIVINDLLPQSPPETPGYEWGILSKPSTEIGGDFFHIAHFPEKNRTAVILSDISGHGIPAALLLTILKLRISEIFGRYVEPGIGMTELNRALARDFPPDYFAVTFCAMLDPLRRAVTYCKASPEPAIILKRDRRIALLDKGAGLAPGAFDPDVFGESSYEEHTQDFAPGDTLLLFTDGVTEIMDATKRQLRLEGLLRWLPELHGRPPQALVEALHERAWSYAGRDEFDDDLTLLAARYSADY